MVVDDAFARDSLYWDHLDQLVATSQLVIDRPRGSPHPRYPEIIYPLDYGYLSGTAAMDGGGIDVWVGTSKADRLTGVVVTVDLVKRDAETKLLLCCSQDEMSLIQSFHNGGGQAGLLLARPAEGGASV